MQWIRVAWFQVEAIGWPLERAQTGLTTPPFVAWNLSWSPGLFTPPPPPPPPASIPLFARQKAQQLPANSFCFWPFP